MTQPPPAAPARIPDVPRPDAPAPDTAAPQPAAPPAAAPHAAAPGSGAPGSGAPGAPARRRSGFVALGMVGTLALALSGCSSSSGKNPPSRCVDPTTLKVLDSHSCAAKGTTTTAGRWYYCGSGGSTAVGGTFDKAATKRGGFGCPSGSSGSGGG
ncbi:hypothetical protein ACFVFS_18220 [Kitasatospora sp. NPDC057692]|uniref:hypothetical protein n=1 Tax=Kitasatospora sp. NPDC057692 TaxID=3346215 RepID=UPI0036B70E79